jgi:uncharacterized protein YggE
VKVVRIALVALVVLAVAALAGVGRPEPAGGASDDAREGITVTGTGQSRAIPDRANLSFGVQTDGATAARALGENSAATRRLIEALEDAGVDARDLKTEHLDVSPRYNDKGGRERGYSAHSTVSVSNQPLDRAARLADVGVAAGADTLSGPSLSLADPDGHYRRALDGAFEDARAKAEVLAAAAGVSLGEVTTVVESEQHDGPVWAMAARAEDTKTPIEPGSQQITASVTVTFAIS